MMSNLPGSSVPNVNMCGVILSSGMCVPIGKPDAGAH
jgi:hypothetical protein